MWYGGLDFAMVVGGRGVWVTTKELLRPGVYHTRSGPVAFTRDDLRRYCENTNRMIESGRLPSAPLEHQRGAIPVSEAERKAQRVLHNAGYTHRLYMDGESLCAVLGIENRDVWQNLAAIKFASPEISPRFEADGTVWEDVVTHVALTTQPVWKDHSWKDHTKAVLKV